MGASSAGGGASGRGEERTDSTKAKIKAATHMMAGLSLITGAVVHWNRGYLDRAVRQLRAQGTTVPEDLQAAINCAAHACAQSAVPLRKIRQPDSDQEP